MPPGAGGVVGEILLIAVCGRATPALKFHYETDSWSRRKPLPLNFL